MTQTYLRLSTLLFTCLAGIALASLSGCASDENRSSTSNASSTMMSTDSKDMNHRN